MVRVLAGALTVIPAPLRERIVKIFVPPLEILISTDVPLTAKVLPVPTKFSVLIGPDVMVVPADEIPRLNPPVAVTTPTTKLLGATDCMLVENPAKLDALDIL